MAKSFWSIENNALVWRVADGEPHTDDIEMSGLRCDCIVSYGVKEDGSLALSQKCFFPALRTIPNNTHATYCFALGEAERVRLLRNGTPVREYPEVFRFDGVLTVESKTGRAKRGLSAASSRPPTCALPSSLSVSLRRRRRTGRCRRPPKPYMPTAEGQKAFTSPRYTIPPPT